jgi:PAS domain S-box-containing protein
MLVNDNTNAFRSFEKVVNPTELLEIFDDPVILLDQQFFIKYINKACADSLEYSSSDLLGMPFFNLLQPSDIAEVSETLKTCVMSPNTKLSAEHAVIHKGRNVERYKTSAVSVRMSDEKLYIMLHMKNISEQYRIRELADTTAVLYEVIAEQASDSFLIHDYYGNLIQVNKKACDALGYTREELLKMTIMDIDPSFALQDAQLKWQDIEPGFI